VETRPDDLNEQAGSVPVRSQVAGPVRRFKAIPGARRHVGVHHGRKSGSWTNLAAANPAGLPV